VLSKHQNLPQKKREKKVMHNKKKKIGKKGNVALFPSQTLVEKKTTRFFLKIISCSNLNQFCNCLPI
jgi:hypothetical protein